MGFPESLCPVRWSAEWEVLLARVGVWAEEGTRPRQDWAAGPPSSAVTLLPPFSLKQLESQVRCLEKETTELKEAVEQQKVKNNDLREKNWKAMEALTSAERGFEEKLHSLTQAQRMQLGNKTTGQGCGRRRRGGGFRAPAPARGSAGNRTGPRGPGRPAQSADAARLCSPRPGLGAPLGNPAPHGRVPRDSQAEGPLSPEGRVPAALIGRLQAVSRSPDAGREIAASAQLHRPD